MNWLRENGLLDKTPISGERDFEENQDVFQRVVLFFARKHSRLHHVPVNPSVIPSEISLHLVFSALLDHGFVPSSDFRGKNVLHTVAESFQQVCDKDALMVLVNRGVLDPNQKSFQGDTALHFAASQGHLDLVKLLTKDLTASAFIRNNDGNTPLHLAAQNGRDKVVQWFLSEESGPIFGDRTNREAQNNLGQTALHLAALGGHHSTIRLMIELGCDLTLKDKAGRTVSALIPSRSTSNPISLLSSSSSPLVPLTSSRRSQIQSSCGLSIAQMKALHAKPVPPQASLVTLPVDSFSNFLTTQQMFSHHNISPHFTMSTDLYDLPSPSPSISLEEMFRPSFGAHCC